MKKPIILFVLLILFLSGAICQDFDNYKPIISSGYIPGDFTKLSKEKYLVSRNNIDNRQSHKIKRAKKEFLLKSNFEIDNILRSGLVTFNDPISKYVDKVVDYILKDFPDLRSELRFYMIKSSEVNAFATNQGIIFVTVGLLAQLQNEAQLAYILSHEIIHYKEKHNINEYVASEMVNSGDFKHASRSEWFNYIFNYSKEQESEADIKGLKEIYLKTDYRVSEVKKMFDVLLYSYLPIDEVKFSPDCFGAGFIKFPEDYFLEEINPITAVEDYNDSRSYHPNIKKRRAKIRVVTDKYEDGDKKLFIVSEDEFAKVRKIARYELSYIYQQRGAYEKAIYNSFILLKNNPESKFLQTNIAECLYGLNYYKSHGNYSKVHKSHKKVEGFSQQVNYFFKKISKLDLNIISLRYLWKLQQKHKDDKYINLLTDSVFAGLIHFHKLVPDDFHRMDSSETFKEMSEEDYNKLDKYEKIKYRKKVKRSKQKEGYIYYAFVDLFEDSEFGEKFNELVSINLNDDNSENKDYAKRAREQRLQRRRGKALGVDKVVIMNPSYIKSDNRKRNSVRYISAERNQVNFTNLLKKNAKKNNLDLEMLNPITFSEPDVNMFNDYALMNSWFYESVFHEKKGFIIGNRKYIDDLIVKYNTKYFAWTGIETIIEKNAFDGVNFLYHVLSIYGIPWGIYRLLDIDQEFHFDFILFDIEKGEPILYQSFQLEEKDKNDILNSYIYDSFMQIKNRRK